MFWRSGRIIWRRCGGRPEIVLDERVGGGMTCTVALPLGCNTGGGSSRKVVPLRRDSRTCANKVDKIPVGLLSAGCWYFFSERSFLSESGGVILSDSSVAGGAF